MPDVVVRFAPSPTGYLHVGGARTALFNWLFARHHGGRFLLRIEDTDRQRSTPEAIEAIFEGLRWLGLDWDGEPLFQSTRLKQHQELVSELLEKGAAYRCFCDPQVLAEQQREAQADQRLYCYPGTCRQLSTVEVSRRLEAGEPFAVRFRTPPGKTSFDDAVHGRIEVDHREIDDFILLRRDGMPVYQVAVVSDDLFMGITHIIRGDDHISNTPKQILIYQALGKPVPQFAHVPLILGPDKKRLSKRHGATSVTEYRDRGIHREAMRNFLVLLGWSPGEDREILEIKEMIDLFDLKGINPAGAVFDEEKLQWMNAKYISAMPSDELWAEIEPFLQKYCRKAGIIMPPEALGIQLAGLFRERMKTFSEAPQMVDYFLRDPQSYEEKGVKKHWKAETSQRLAHLVGALEKLPEWRAEAIELVFDRVAEEAGVKRGELIHPVRLALTGRTASPGIFEVMQILGKPVCLRRIRRAVKEITPS